MNKKTLFILWTALFILCAVLGFIPPQEGILKILRYLVSLLFFLPPALILAVSIKEKDLAAIRLMRNLSFLSLLVTLILILLNIISAVGPLLLGDILYSILVIASSPMICWGNWFLSLFLWACLLMVSLRELKKK